LKLNLLVLLLSRLKVMDAHHMTHWYEQEGLNSWAHVRFFTDLSKYATVLV